jgi:prevent-host-death family protein
MNTDTCFVNVQEAKNNFSKLLARAHAGEEITICKAGKPFAKLIAIEQPAQRELGFLSDLFSEAELVEMNKALLEPMNEDELAIWYDATVIQTRQFAERNASDEDVEE